MIEVVRLSQAAAELLIHVDFPNDPGPATELRGRLMGPRSPTTGTVEVAYALRPLPPTSELPGRRSARVVIPEPNFWEPASPFTYRGPVEVWESGTKRMELPVEIGLGRKS
jgi:hypothetical protein